MSKVLFITPPYECWGVQTIGTWPPLHLAYLAGAARDAGHEAKIYDAMNKKHSFDDVRTAIEAYRPEVVMAIDYLPVTGAISTATVPAALSVLAIAKEVDPGIVTMIGGPHPTFMYEELLTDEENRADFVLRGEMEETLVDLLHAIAAGETGGVKGVAYRTANGEIIATQQRPHIVDLDELRPAFDLLDWEDYKYNIEPYGRMASILTSRGCMMGCSFCSQRLFWRGDWRARTPEKVIDEIRELVDVHEVHFITLIDAYPTRDRERWERFLDLLIEANLPVKFLIETRVEDIIRDEDLLPKYHEAGVIHVYLGAESSSDEILESLNKGSDVEMNKKAIDLLREHDIMTEASFMIGFPTETWDTIKQTVEVAMRLNPDIAVFPVLTPMPFTPLWDEMYDRIRVFDYSKYNLTTPIIEPYGMALDDILKALGICYMTFYANKMKEVLALPDGFKRRYMLSAFTEMMRDYGAQFDFFGMGMASMPNVPGMMAAARATRDAKRPPKS